MVLCKTKRNFNTKRSNLIFFFVVEVLGHLNICVLLKNAKQRAISFSVTEGVASQALTVKSVLRFTPKADLKMYPFCAPFRSPKDGKFAPPGQYPCTLPARNSLISSPLKKYVTDKPFQVQCPQLQSRLDDRSLSHPRFVSAKISVFQRTLIIKLFCFWDS